MRREGREDKMRNKCRYFNGTKNSHCRRGIMYLTMKGWTEYNHNYLPCFPKEQTRGFPCAFYVPYPKYKIIKHEIYWAVRNFISIRWCVVRPKAYPWDKRVKVEFYSTWTGAWNAHGDYGIITHITLMPFVYLKEVIKEAVK